MSDIPLSTMPEMAPENWIERVFPRISGKRIELNGEPYLTRYYLLGNGSGHGYELYLHHLRKEDKSRWLHNHPWRWFLSIVLRGSYVQRVRRPQSDANERLEKIRFLNVFRGKDRYHSITQVPQHGTWTLVLVPPKTKDTQDWGYWDSDASVHLPDADDDEEDTKTYRFGPKQTFN